MSANNHHHAKKTPESKKEEFRKYLEKSGVIDALTKVLVGLYEEPERPPNAVDYIKRYDSNPPHSFLISYLLPVFLGCFIWK